jgi:hypothetical protein
MINRKQTEKQLKDLLSFLGQYIILVFNHKKQYKYISENSYQKIIIHIVTFVLLITSVGYFISKIYSITKPLPIIYLPLHIIIFSVLCLLPNSYMYTRGRTKSEVLEYIKQTILSTIIIVSFNCTIAMIMYSLFIVSESYFIYYLMVSIIILLNIYFFPVRYLITIKNLKKYVKIIRLTIILICVYCILSLVSLNQFSFVYKGKTFVHSFDPIYQELLDNMNDRQEIMKYIIASSELMRKVMTQVVISKEFEMYDLLMQQIDAISNKDIDIKNIYNNLIFNKNKIMYEHIIYYISISKSIKNELERLQFVTNIEFDDVRHEIENDINQLDGIEDELRRMKLYIKQHEPEQNELEQSELENFLGRMDEMKITTESIGAKQGRIKRVISQVEINILVISELNNLTSRNIEIIKKINDEMDKETKIIRAKLRWSWLLNGI